MGNQSSKCALYLRLLSGESALEKTDKLFSIVEYTLKKIRYLLLSETLLGFPRALKRTRKVSEWLGNPKRVSDSNKYRIFLECTIFGNNLTRENFISA
jgi:hypothetical protein